MTSRLLALWEDLGQVTGRPRAWIVLPRLVTDGDHLAFLTYAGEFRGRYTSLAFARNVARTWTGRTSGSVTWEALPADRYEPADAPLSPLPAEAPQ